MSYTPPIGTVDLSLAGSYTPPVGTVNLSIGAGVSLDRSLTLTGETLAPVGALSLRREPIATLTGETLTPLGGLHLLSGRVAEFSGETLAPTGELLIGKPVLVTLAGETLSPLGLIHVQRVVKIELAGETLAPTGLLDVAYDPNLLSAVHALTGEGWQAAETYPVGPESPWQTAQSLISGGPERWQTATATLGATVPGWQAAAALASATLPGWQIAPTMQAGSVPIWQQAGRIDRGSADVWQAADARRQDTLQTWRDLPLATHRGPDVWQAGRRETRSWTIRANDGARLTAVAVEVWQPGGYPGNADNPDKDAVPPTIPTPWGARLRLVCALPGTRLRLGRTPCILIADREVAMRRTYMSVNSAQLVRLPDLTPLPVTNLTVETDFDSWCWALSATLAGPDAWSLVQPNPLACEVQATVNGQVWKFLLDVPNQNRAFNNDRVSLKGRSRSAWLHEPYQVSVNREEANAREMIQVAEAALANSGWTLDWALENWLIPAGRYHSYNTSIGALIRLVQVTDDGLYTEPALQVLRATKRWPVASWLLDAETADLAIPESAVISLSQSPVYSPPYNGVYVSGTTHGALALVKIAGTDGALQPGEPLTHELLCDEAGVGARQRGLNFLSDSGAGFTLDAEVLFTPEVGLVRPGLIVSIAGMKGVSRSVKISAQWGGDGLTVRQSVGLERREVET